MEARPGPADPSQPGAPRRVLYRCRTPTNFLCPCGTVARRLKKLGVEHRVERVSQRRRGRRPEIVELTGQERVPVFVEGDEVVHDSKRILEYLDWAHSEGPERPRAEKS
jgi:glutathione S-transferase